MLLALLQIHTIYTFAVAVTANRDNISISTPPVPCLVEQASSLLRFKDSFSSAAGDSGTFQSWIAGTDCCSWEGVGCGNADGHVTRLDLGGRQLQATVGLDPALFTLTSLSHLDLSGNDFNNSQLPSAGFEHLAALTHLDLSDTNFAGSVPSGIGHCSGLIYLDLSTSFYEYDYDNENKVMYYSYPMWQLSVPNMATLLANLTNLEELHLGMVNLSASGAGWCDDLARFSPKIQELEHPEEPVSEFTAWATSHQGPVKSGALFRPSDPVEAFSDPTAYAKARDYLEATRVVHGPEHDVCVAPLDTEVIVRLGEGSKHGRLWIANSADSSSSAPRLSDVRAQSTARSLPIRTRPTPTLSRVDELQEELTQTKDELTQTKQTTAFLSAQLEATQKQVADMLLIMQTMGERTGVPVQLSAAAPVQATMPPSAGSNYQADNVSPAVDRVNHSPQSTPAPQTGCPHPHFRSPATQ